MNENVYMAQTNSSPKPVRSQEEGGKRRIKRRHRQFCHWSRTENTSKGLRHGHSSVVGQKQKTVQWGLTETHANK